MKKTKFTALLTAAAIALSMLTTGAFAASGVAPKIKIQSDYTQDTGIVSVTLSVEDARFIVFQTLLDYDDAVLTPCTPAGADAATAVRMTEFLAPRAQANLDYREGSTAPKGSGWLDTSIYELKSAEKRVDASLIVSPDSRDAEWENGAASDGFTPGDANSQELVKLYFRVKDGQTLADGSLKLGADPNQASALMRAKPTFANGGTVESESADYACSAAGQSVLKDGGLTLAMEPIADQNDDSGTPGDGTPGDGTTGDANTGAGAGTGTSGGSAAGSNGTSGQNGEDSGATTVPSGSTVAFTDVSGHWAADSIRVVAEKGIVKGNPDGTFQPDATMTRGALAAILNRYYKLTPAVADFEDISGNWAKDDIGAAVGAGLMNGVGNGKFDPDGAVSRAMLATVLTRAEKLATPAAPELFRDDAAIEDWAREGVYAARSAGLMTGNPDGGFAPAKSATRAEIVTVLARMMTNAAQQ